MLLLLHGHRRQRQRQHHRYSILQPPSGKTITSLLWCIGFLSFGCMNITGLVLHCLLKAPMPVETTYPEYNRTTRWFWMMDCLFTGCSSTALTMASLLELVRLPASMTVMPTTSPCSDSSPVVLPSKRTMILVVLFGMIHILGLVLALVALYEYNATIGMELWYLLPSYGAAHTVNAWWWDQVTQRITRKSQSDHQDYAVSIPSISSSSPKPSSPSSNSHPPRTTPATSAA